MNYIILKAQLAIIIANSGVSVYLPARTSRTPQITPNAGEMLSETRSILAFSGRFTGDTWTALALHPSPVVG